MRLRRVRAAGVVALLGLGLLAPVATAPAGAAPAGSLSAGPGADPRLLYTVPGARYANALAVDRRTQTVYLGTGEDDSLALVRGREVSVASSVACCGQYDLAVDPRTSRGYAVGIDDSTLYEFDAADGRATRRVPLGFMPRQVEVDPRRHRVYVSGHEASGGAGRVHVLDGRTLQRLAVHTGQVFADVLAVDPVTETVHLVDGLSVLDLDGRTLRVRRHTDLSGALVGVRHLAVNTVTGRLYLLGKDDQGRDLLLVRDGQDGSPVHRVTLPLTGEFSYTALAVNKRRNQVLVADRDRDSLLVLDGRTDRVSGRVHVGESPSAIAVDPRQNRIYVGTSDGLAALAAG